MDPRIVRVRSTIIHNIETETKQKQNFAVKLGLKNIEQIIPKDTPRKKPKINQEPKAEAQAIMKQKIWQKSQSSMVKKSTMNNVK